MWQGQVLDLTVDIGVTPHRVYIGGPQNEAQWLPLQRMLPETQGGIRLHTDWDAIESNLVRPLRDGAVLPDFNLEGPLDLFLTPPADLQLWLPHSVEAGVQHRVMLRPGVAVTVRGARSVQLRRPIDLPHISLADFVDFATEDKYKHQAAGLMHLATGLREKAIQHYNTSSSSSSSKTKTGEKEQGKPPMTPALVALDIDFSSSVGSGSSRSSRRNSGQGTLFAAPDEHGSLQKLRVKRMGDGVLEISLRKKENESSETDGGNSDGGSSRLSVDSSKALVIGRPGSPSVWPFRSASPETVATYEHLLRELLSRQIFSSAASTAAPKTKETKETKKGGVVIAPEEMPLKLHQCSSSAVFLMKMEFAVLKAPVQERKNSNEKSLEQRKKESKDIPPTPGQLLIKTATGGGIDLLENGDSDDGQPRREVYSTVVKIEGSAREGLNFSPVGPLQLVERTSATTATFDMAGGALAQVAGELGLGALSNASVTHIRDEL